MGNPSSPLCIGGLSSERKLKDLEHVKGKLIHAEEDIGYGLQVGIFVIV